jgi:ribosomal protein L6P/L9E
MSLRNFSKPINLNGAECLVQDSLHLLKGKKGEMYLKNLPSFLDLIVIEGAICMQLSKDKSKASLDKSARALIGTVNSTLKSIIKGVNEGHNVSIIFTGTGAGVEIKGTMLHLKVGKSHIVNIPFPKGIECSVPTGNTKVVKLVISGVDLCRVRQFAKEICDLSKNRYEGGIHIFPENNPPVLKKGKK